MVSVHIVASTYRTGNNKCNSSRQKYRLADGATDTDNYRPVNSCELLSSCYRLVHALTERCLGRRVGEWKGGILADSLNSNSQ